MPADNATSNWVWHVRNDKVGSMTAAVRIDGAPYAILGPLGALAPPPPPGPPPANPVCTPGLNFGGGDMKQHCPEANTSLTTAPECRTLCESVTGCVAFIFDNKTVAKPGCDRSKSFPAPRCWLKQKIGGTGEHDPDSCAGFIGKPNPPPGGLPKPTPTAGGQCPSASAIPPLEQRGPPLILPTRTIFSFAGAGIAVNLTFSSPKFLGDLESFVPVALVQISVQAIDGKQHDVSAFFELTGQMVVDKDQEKVSWARDQALVSGMPEGTQSMKIWQPGSKGLEDLGDSAVTEHMTWGQTHLTALLPRGGNVTSWMGSSNRARGSWKDTGQLPAADETVMPLPACASGICKCGIGGVAAANDWPSLTAAWNFPAVEASGEVYTSSAVLSSDDLGQSARYFGTVMGEYWRRNNRTSFESMLTNLTHNYSGVIEQCVAYDEEMVSEMIAAGGEDYATVGALSYRQVLGDNSVVWFEGTPPHDAAPASKPTTFMFVKGLGSSGDTGTIDDNYPAGLFYLWKQPALLNALLQPINYYMQNYSFCPTCGWPKNQTWQVPFSIHYLGQYLLRRIYACHPNPSIYPCVWVHL